MLTLADKVDSCDCLFLIDIAEPQENQLRILVREATASPEEEALTIGGVTFEHLHRIESSDASPTFELVWDSYIAYSVRNESYAAEDESNVWSGNKLRTYSKSSFLAYIASATIATSEYPGPFRHYGLVCEDHVVDVVSAARPQIRQVEHSS